MIITEMGLPIAEMNLTLLDDQEVIGIDLSFVKVLFMQNMDNCFILAILVTCNLLSFMFEMFRDCSKLKLSIFE